ncbi:MAG: formylglycine-generating enzyme family protein [Humibacillus sp.]|nr:formylglycine-generating enzyme family protein [Humibacillus sp.]MDN5778067.1 formylglycine-generating enzyme family protein [Humibacillus sp.]
MTNSSSTDSSMVLVPGGSFRMGSSDFYPDERPVHGRDVAAFEIDRHPVTNRQFAAFVDDTGYLTVAERELDPADFPGADPADLHPGGLVFTPTRGPVNLGGWRQWWRWQVGAHWRAPAGPGSTIDDRLDHPVVQVSYDDACAFADWAGGRLPTETEWEYAAGGSATPGPYAWGAEPRPGGVLMANTWQGSFPYRNTGAAGWVGTSPVGTFPPNTFGLVDMIGNVWEWTSDYYTSSHTHAASAASEAPAPLLAVSPPQGGVAHCGCGPTDGRGPTTNSQAETEHAARASAEPGSVIPRRVLKGGSHLCAPEYCLRYRPAARSPQAQDTATSHIGFRLARSR